MFDIRCYCDRGDSFELSLLVSHPVSSSGPGTALLIWHVKVGSYALPPEHHRVSIRLDCILGKLF